MMKFPKSVRSSFTLGLIAAALLAGCGGGGGDNGSTAPAIANVDLALQSAMSAYAAASRSFSLSGSVTTAANTVATYTMDYSYVPAAGTTTFEGSTVSTALQTVTVRQEGVTTPLLQQSQRSYFTVQPYAIYGSIDQTSSAYTVVSRTGSVPVTARIGQSGTLGTETEYSDSSKTTATGSSVLTWTIEADTVDTALLCIKAQFAGLSSSTNCYRIDRSGSVTGLIVRITNDQGATLTLK